MLLIDKDKIRYMRAYGRLWVPNPLNYKPDKARQKRARDAVK